MTPTIPLDAEQAAAWLLDPSRNYTDVRGKLYDLGASRLSRQMTNALLDTAYDALAGVSHVRNQYMKGLSQAEKVVFVMKVADCVYEHMQR